ncbi:hypothetical protein [Sphingomonas lenta]|uniref:Rhamnan synthesis protein F n=1 Tax=Sphingomonas lenta TaxID=1141887 RepID=A0A2A2SIW1_9SPHN|nr:hypothetical protein [Sphingomonas lenta]PAX09224.1 hypothetical protein CKY28_00165 [Sphingomonas lenta]
MLLRPTPELAALRQDWTFAPNKPPWRVQVRRLGQRVLRRVPAPARRVLRSPAGVGAWTIYFVFTPDGLLQAPHRFALDRLRALGRPLLVVCAAPSPADIPADLAAAADALVWKDLPGFDFSAYTAGLATLAEHCPGSDALVLNDSTFGPLVDLAPWLALARWDLTGFTATANVENHIQSYAFHLKGVTPARMRALGPVLMPAHAYDRFWGVVLNQETRFARVASRSMSVGSLLFSDMLEAEDPTLQLALPLVRAGFPFLKRSLLGGKLAHLHPEHEVRDALRAAGYPA